MASTLNAFTLPLPHTCNRWLQEGTDGSDHAYRMVIAEREPTAQAAAAPAREQQRQQHGSRMRVAFGTKCPAVPPV